MKALFSPETGGVRACGIACFFFLIPLSAGCGRLSRPEGPATARAEDGPKTVAVTLFGERLELFMEHPFLVRREASKFNVHLTVLKDGMPIRAGKLTVVANGPSGKATTVEQAAPRSPGIFGPTVTFSEAGKNETVLTLRSEQADETFRVPVTVYADEAADRSAADAADEPEPEGSITFLEEQQWKIGLVAERVARHHLVVRLAVPGLVVPRAGGKAMVTPPIAGRVLPLPKGRFPLVGDVAKAGDVVAGIELRTAADTVLRRRLLSAPGASQVIPIGGA
jgi:cobalt-zinc-cadmium efflux system membrane fusion protein